MSDDYVAAVSVQLTDEKVRIFSPWFVQNKIKSHFSFGKYYFKSKEDALAFKLRFGDLLHGA